MGEEENALHSGIWSGNYDYVEAIGGWSVERAKELIAIKRARHEYEVPQCPACNGDADMEWVIIKTAEGHVQAVPGILRCSADCFERDPERYLEAVELYALKRSEALVNTTDVVEGEGDNDGS